MLKNHRSFFERLTGSIATNDEEEMECEETSLPEKTRHPSKIDWAVDDEEGQLAIDMFQTSGEIIIQAVIAGVGPDELDVSITQDMVTIHGKRQKQREISTDDYYHQELYWGTFSRSISLPHEVDAEMSEATLKKGLLTIKLPKLDRNRVQKVKVKNE